MVVQLPKEEQDALVALHKGGDRVALKSRILALRAQKWPLRAIGEPMGVGRSTVQMWEQSSSEVDQSMLPEDVKLSPRAIETAGVKEVRWKVAVSSEDVYWLRTLYLSARKVRSQTPQSSPLRANSAELDELIEHYLNKMVPVTDIARHMGVTHRAVKARLERRNA